MTIEIYTDGSCLNNPGPGGFAFLVIKDGEITEEISGGLEDNPTTNNRAELTAAIEALDWVPNKDIILYTDSTYVQKGMTIWIKNWKRKGWKKVKNVDLWKKLDSLAENRNITWKWVKAHDKNPYNNRVDELAREEAENI
jgi:ribonuclease HI